MSKVNDNTEFDNEIIVVMRNLLDRMGDTDIPNSGSFITLRQTLSYYLSQDENINHGAKWIVRGFEQIDGDILKSDDKNDNPAHSIKRPKLDEDEVRCPFRYDILHLWNKKCYYNKFCMNYFVEKI